MNDERKGSLKKLIKKKTQKCQTVHKGNLNVVAAFCPRGRKKNHQDDQILSTNSLQKYLEISQEKLYLYSVA